MICHIFSFYVIVALVLRSNKRTVSEKQAKQTAGKTFQRNLKTYTEKSESDAGDYDVEKIPVKRGPEMVNLFKDI